MLAGDYLLSIGLDCLAGDADADGVPDASDCAPANGAAWAVPGPAPGLLLSGRGPTALAWDAPAEPGGTALLYDVLRSPSPSDFSGAAVVCLATGLTARAASDPDPPPPAGTGRVYLVRSRNACGSNLGANSSGTPRTGRTCP